MRRIINARGHMDTHIITHGGCPDGHTSAWLLHHYFNRQQDYSTNLHFHDGKYGEPPPDIGEGDGVIIADFSYSREEMIALAEKADFVEVYDHHYTAKKNLDGLEGEIGNMSVVFDMDRSGARIVWDTFGAPPEFEHLVKYVEDRDLWRKELHKSDEIGAVILSTPFTFEDWDALNSALTSSPSMVIAQGEAILRNNWKMIESIAKTARPMVIGGHEVPVVGCPYQLGSETAGKLAEENPAAAFAGYYIDWPDQRQFGLRARKDADVNVAEVAELYGGGGHPSASGFKVPWGHELAPAC